MNKITHKFYIVGLLLVLFFGLGYAQLAFFLQHESRNTSKVQEHLDIERKIQQLRRLFIEIRFWERIIFSQGTPEAERQFGQLLKMFHQQLETLQKKAIVTESLNDLNVIKQTVSDYENTFAQIVQLETEQRLGKTLLENTYQSLTANILKEKETNLLRPIFNLAHFQQCYLDNHRQSEYQALKIVIQILKKKLQQQSTDNRLIEYLSRYSELLHHDFLMEESIQLLNKNFDALSGQLTAYLHTALELTNSIVEQEKKMSTQLRRRLNMSFLISMTLAICGIFLISAYILRQIIKPILALSEVSRNIQEGMISARFTPIHNAPKELLELGRSFNIMLNTLASREQELAKHRDSLEEQVSLRTRTLNNTNKALNQEIATRIETEKELKHYADTQLVLLKEVNHRVKNNLTAIISMIHQEVDRADKLGIKGDKYQLKEVAGRVDGLLIVHSLLSASKWKPLQLSQLCQEVIFGTIRGLIPLDSIKLDVASSDVRVDADQAHSLALILNELTTNTIKYGAEHEERYSIIVSIDHKDGMVHLIYRDHGPGFPESVVKGQIPETCIGMNMISGIIHKNLDGEIQLMNEGGAVFTITFARYDKPTSCQGGTL